MKIKLKTILVGIASILSFGSLVGCSNAIINSPEDAIIDAYGDRQFKISFDSTNLENPIADLYYTAKNMPVLPTPSKVGYVFAGWYFDSNFIDQCDVDKGDLLWKMTNVTLYAKWDKEQIVNNGQYDIEFEAHIVKDSIAKGPLADKYGYYHFDEDIVKYGTYIEKNDKGVFLRIQYDSRTRGPVLGGEGSDANNFSKQTYTVSDYEGRINKELSIFDRTSTLQTVYYDISGLDLDETINLHIEYYNWTADLPDKVRKQASVAYTVEFNITRFIGFGAPFINNKARLEDGIYEVPTHYTGLDKGISVLDAFNPVISYIKASNGNYTLYKPMSAYNNDVGSIQSVHYPLRDTGFAKEFACFLVDQNIVLTAEQDANSEGKYFIPELFNANKYTPIRCEFNHEKGQYFYVIELGDSLDHDIVTFGGSSGAMEQMFSFGFSYRRLTIDYNSMVRIADWDYQEPIGDRYVFSKTATYYPGSGKDFVNSNTDFNHYQKNKSSVDYPNCFFSKDADGNVKVYTSRVNIAPKYPGTWVSGTRNSYQYFDMTFEIFGYDPIKDGTLYSRDLTFTTNGSLSQSNSFINENINGKSLNVGDPVSIYDLYKEKVCKENSKFTFKAFEVDNALRVNFKKQVKLADNFNFENNIAILYDCDFVNHHRQSLVLLAKKEAPSIKLVDNDWAVGANNTIITDKRFNIGDEIRVPNIQYTYYGKKFYTGHLQKSDLDNEPKRTDFTNVSFWTLSQGVYTAHSYSSTEYYDFVMDQEKIVALYQLENQFGEFVPYTCLFKGATAGEFEISDEHGKLILSGDLKYDANKPLPIRYEYSETIDIINEVSISNVSRKLNMKIVDENVVTNKEIPFSFALVYTRKECTKIYELNNLWDAIKNEEYAIVFFYYQNDDMDQILCKGQFNFKIEGDAVNEFKILDEAKTYFTYQRIRLDNPLLSDFNNKKLTYGYPEIKKKVGKNYTSNAYDSFEIQATEYSTSISFKEEGTYLLAFTFTLLNDSKGNSLFPYNPNGDTMSQVRIKIAQEIVVCDRNIDVGVTFVTDDAHPFNLESNELFGYKIEKRDGLQYASKKIKANEKIKSFTVDAFICDPNDSLYKWGNKNNELVATPGSYISNYHISHCVKDGFFYAKWDQGATVTINYQIKDDVRYYNSIKVYKSSITGREEYNFDTIKIGGTSNIVPGYVVYGWKADQNVFFESIEIDGEERLVKTNFLKGDFNGNKSLQLYGDIVLTGILKKPTIVKYEAYDTNGNKKEFLNPINTDYKMFIDDLYIEDIARNKVDLVKNPVSTDLDLQFKYWEVYDASTGEYLRCDLDTLVLLEQYQDGNAITLRAIFG